MAVVKWDPSKRQKFSDNLSSTEEMCQSTDISAAKRFASSNPFTHFYCKRIVTENPEGVKPIVTRIEEVSFGFKPSSLQMKNLHAPKSKYAFKHSEKKKKRKTEDKENGIKKNNIHKICAVAVILGCNAVLWWLLSVSYYCQLAPLKIDDIEASLRSKVIGQEEALNSLILALYRTSNSLKSQLPVLLVCGSTGVGKSFISDILIDHFENIGHAELVPLPAPDPKMIVEKLDGCKHNMLVLDGLHVSDAPEMVNWTVEVQQAADLRGKRVLLIFFFNTWSWSPNDDATSDAEFFQDIWKVSMNVEELFRRNRVSTELISLRPMEIHHIRSCVQQTLLRMNLVASQQAIKKIVEDLTASPDQRRRGCKHVSRYLLLSGPELVSLKSDDKTISKDDL